MRWAQISLNSERDLVEAVSAALTEAGCAGVVVEDPSAKSSDPFADYAADLVERAETDGCKVMGYLPVDDRLEAALDDISVRLQILKEAGLAVDEELTLRTVEESQWAEAWKAYFKPLRVGKHFVIKPTWEEWEAEEEDRILHLDPGMAFGSGTHPTTRLCLQLLEGVIRPGDRVLDWGTGSGILAVGAALLDAAEILAVDLDPTAVSAAMENARVNGFPERIHVSLGSIEQIDAGGFDVVVANIVADPIIAGAPQIAAHLRSGGHAIVSGIIDLREAEVLEALRAAGLTVEQVLAEEDWRAILLLNP